jgi:uncharacterized protein (DUF1330 family)
VERDAAWIEALLRELSQRHELGGLHPGTEQLRSLLERGPDGPLQFLNLLAYREVARYPSGHELAGRQLSGAQAYALYGQVALRHVTQRGGRLVALNDVEQGLIGADLDWHQIAIMEYPSVDAFVDMLRDPDYLAALAHRDAGLERTVVLVSRPRIPPAS